MGIRPRTSLLNPDLVRPSALDATPRSHASIWLDKNENLDPELLRESNFILKDLPPLTVATYPEAGSLYRKIAGWLNLPAEYLILTPGSDGAIRLVFEAFIDTGDIVVITDPTFAMYSVYSQMFGAKVQKISYTSKNNSPYLDFERMLSVINESHPKLVCLPNPDSPTGTVLSENQFLKLLKTCETNESVLLIDEAYHPFYKWTALPWIRESPNLIVARTFAKAWGAAGMRIGYAVAQPSTISILHKLRPMYEVSTISIEFMDRMIEKVPAMEKSVAKILEGKAYFQQSMRDLGYQVAVTEGNFVHIRFGESAEIVQKSLQGHVLYRGTFGNESLLGFSRFSVGPLEVMEKVVQLISTAHRNENPK
ncbi:HisC Histidinol-phosphate/aromatic aminotransferase and cobyric acid decarboxylase [Candidatus Nanopelagicaceae bacterium]